MSLKPKFTPFPHEKKFAEKRESCDLDLKAYWENDNDDERDFVSTMRGMLFFYILPQNKTMKFMSIGISELSALRRPLPSVVDHLL